MWSISGLLICAFAHACTDARTEHRTGLVTLAELPDLPVVVLRDALKAQHAFQQCSTLCCLHGPLAVQRNWLHNYQLTAQMYLSYQLAAQHSEHSDQWLSF